MNVFSTLTHGFLYVSFPQDYPSLALLGEKLAENNIFLIFAVTKRHYVLYKVMYVNQLIVLGKIS